MFHSPRKNLPASPLYNLQASPLPILSMDAIASGRIVCNWAGDNLQVHIFVSKSAKLRGLGDYILFSASIQIIIKVIIPFGK